MGAYRDEQTFAMMDSQQYGAQTGRRMKLASISAGLEVDPEVIDGLGNELDLTKRVERLETIARSVGELLTDSSNMLAIIRDGTSADVAAFVIADQLPHLDENHSYSYMDSCSVYRLQQGDEDNVYVMTKVFGGPMFGPYEFREVTPLTPEWISDRLITRGVERDVEFCEQVARQILRQMTAEGEPIG